MKRNKFGLIVASLALVAMALLVIFGGLSFSGQVVEASEAAAPELATYYCGNSPWCVVTLQSGDSITASAATENVARQVGVNVFNRAELYCTMDETDINTQTVKLQYSPDNSVWVDVLGGACAAQTADGTVAISVTNLSGAYWRGYITLGGANATTPTVKLILKRIP